MDKDLKRRIERLFQEHGDVEYRFERTDHHVRVVARRGSLLSVCIVPTSGSDWRGPRNALAKLRRDLDLQPGKKAQAQRAPGPRPGRKPGDRSPSHRLASRCSPAGEDTRVSLQEALTGLFQGADDLVGMRHG